MLAVLALIVASISLVCLYTALVLMVAMVVSGPVLILFGVFCGCWALLSVGGLWFLLWEGW